jgi:hypothetical protein
MSRVLERYTVPGPDGTIKRKRYVSRVEWRNVGVFAAWRIIREVGIRTPWGNLIFGGWLPFEYRYGGKRPILQIGGCNLRWVPLKAMEDDDA